MFFRKATDLFYSQQHVTAETLTAVIRKFGPEIQNHCTMEGISGRKPAVIPKFTPPLKSRITARRRAFPSKNKQGETVTIGED